MKKCAEDIVDNEKKIDGLLNNAGVMFAPRSYTEDGIETHWAVNHLGHLLLTRLLTPRLKDGGRVVYMVHLDYRKVRDGIPLDDINMKKQYDKCLAFWRSQLANVLVFQELAYELEPLNITVNAAYPGVVSGTMLKRHMGIEKSMVSKLLAKPMMFMIENSVKEGAQTPVFALLDKSLNNTSGIMLANKLPMQMFDCADNPELGIQLLAIGDYWTGLKDKSELAKVKPDIEKRKKKEH